MRAGRMAGEHGNRAEGGDAQMGESLTAAQKAEVLTEALP